MAPALSRVLPSGTQPSAFQGVVLAAGQPAQNERRASAPYMAQAPVAALALSRLYRLTQAEKGAVRVMVTRASSSLPSPSRSATAALLTMVLPLGRRGKPATAVPSAWYASR